MGVHDFLFTAYLLCSIALFCFASFELAATAKLQSEEVEALREIARKLGKKDWDFGKDPCSGEGNWAGEYGLKGFENSVICDCSFNDSSSCHVVSIALKAQNLSGNVPSEFSKLHYLKILDLSRNYLNGTIPHEWAEMRSLSELSFMGNRLSGPFPKVLTNITTLTSLSIEGNLFSGPIPPEIGRLTNLQKLVLASNAFTGELPVELAILANLVDMKINDNNFSGRIPDFIGNWTLIERLHVEGCSLEGPIPSSISALTKLVDLRITDLKGKKSPFPLLRNMQSMKTLILRKCSMHGEIPFYIAEMSNLKILDLSYNELTGEIWESFSQLAKVEYIYLTGNKFTGTIPGSLLNRNKILDLSYNDFTWESLSPAECPHGSVNLVESYSSATDKQLHPCLKRNFPCSGSHDQLRYSLHINCGGREVAINGSKYEADREPGGPSMFCLSQNWAFSSTGNFMDNDIDSNIYIETNKSALFNVSALNSELYTTARASPLSLTYYGLCLMDGNYTVRLHFAEIIFINDRSFYDIGKRIFDVYIQDELVLKDFNIENEAGGAGKPIVKKFTAVVTNHTLKIHFYWAGKGTTGIPDRGYYGPLISAISVDPIAESSPNRNLIIIGISVAVVGLLIIFAIFLSVYKREAIIFWNKEKAKEFDVEAFIRNYTSFAPKRYTHSQVKKMTNSFTNVIGKGGFGCVYEGTLPDGCLVAVKVLKESKHNGEDFINEVASMGRTSHVNIVTLVGFC